MTNVHEKLDRVRKPRVHIKYEVETEGAAIVRELPFIIGVLGDFSGDPSEPLRPFNERKFVQIDRDNFDEVMSRMTPGLNMHVTNTIEGDGSEFPVSLKFECMKDFEPSAIVTQVPVLNSLLEARNELRDLMSKADRSEVLEQLLEQVLEKKAELTQLVKQLEDRKHVEKD